MKALFITLLMFYSGVSIAGEAQPVNAGSCGWLLTEAECRQHQRTLTDMQEPSARLAYMERHMALLREREVMCGCVAERQVMARAQYR